MISSSGSEVAIPCESPALSSNISTSSSRNVESFNGEEEGFVDVKKIGMELQEMTLYLDDIELKLQTGVPSCPRRDAYADGELELYGSRNASVRKLQSDAKKLQHQVAELFDCSKGAKSAMIVVQNSLCNLEKQIINTQRQTESIESIKYQMDLDGARCQQRYKYLRGLLYNWSEVYANAADMKGFFDGRINLLYSKAVYHNEKRNIFNKLLETENSCINGKEELIRQAKHMKGWVNILMEAEPLWNSIVSLVPTKRGQGEFEMQSSVSFSTGWYDLMSSMIKQKSFLARRQ